MKDFIRSPLQFVRPMTEQEWDELVFRGTRRELRRERRREIKQQAAAIAQRRLAVQRRAQAADSSGVF